MTFPDYIEHEEIAPIVQSKLLHQYRIVNLGALVKDDGSCCYLAIEPTRAAVIESAFDQPTSKELMYMLEQCGVTWSQHIDNLKALAPNINKYIDAEYDAQDELMYSVSHFALQFFLEHNFKKITAFPGVKLLSSE